MTREGTHTQLSIEFAAKREVNPHNVADAIYDDFESRTCKNCKHFSLRDMNGELDDKFGFGYCDKGIRDASKEFGCNNWEARTVSTDTKSPQQD